jgi:hypothetical protein
MPLQDEDIAAILHAELGDDFDRVLNIAGVASTGDNVQDFKTLAYAMGVDVEDLLYALFVEDEPIFNEDTWSKLTNDGESEW